ncbi:hypothetical protein [Actinomycetospora sp.]|jgi:uncharacterized membrane protein|uniref:hypothetical protein n=1 Tax=Actinomycetospora sp. TaxID=1872135 RepID=UPI002F40C9D8
MRGRGRQLASMVLANRPWRLILGLRSALAAVLATSLYLIITSTIWQLASLLGWTKLIATTVVSVALMVVWILNAHDLWLRPGDVREDDDVSLQNATTVLTLTIGVTVMAATVFVFNLLLALFFLQPPLFTGTSSDYIRLAWLATGFGTLGGALGSGLDSDSAVLEATYSDPQQQELRSGDDDG